MDDKIKDTDFNDTEVNYDEFENKSDISKIIESLKADINTKDKKDRKYILVHIFSFVLPFVLMMLAYASINLFPFGKADRQIMVIDSWHQYFPFLNELHTKLTSGQSVLYSFGIGGGVNFLALLAYYGSTPIYLLSVFFPKEYLREFMMFATLVKIGCSGLFFSIYIRGMFKRADLSTIAFSVLYALSGFAIGYYWCLMWLECMALLPLVILGLNKLIDENKFVLYSTSLALCLICNYYIAFFVAVFVFFYYFVIYFSRNKFDSEPKKKFIEFVWKTLQVGIFSLVGLGISAVIVLPTYNVLGMTGNAASSFPTTVTVYNTLMDIFTNLLVYTKPAVRAGLPNIACGLAAVIFAIYFFASQKFQLREKLLNGGLLLFLAFSFNINILNYLWHGMHFPNEIPYRFAFVFSFLLLTLAYKAFVNFEETSKRTVIIVFVSMLGYLILAERIYDTTDKFDFKVFYLSVVFLILYTIVNLIYKNNKMAIKYFSLFIFFIACIEGSIAAFNGASTTGSSARDSYPPEQEGITDAINTVLDSDPEPFYRMEMRKWYSTNDPALYGYRGISQFSSMANSRYTRLMEIFGIAASPGSNRYLYSSATPVFNAVFSLKYIMARDSNFNSSVFDEVINDNGIRVYENNYWLPIAFTVNSDIYEWEQSANGNTFLTQNEFMRKITGIQSNEYGFDTFKSIYPSKTEYENLVDSRADYGDYSLTSPDPGKKGKIKHTYVSDKNQQVYMYIKTNRAKDAKVRTPHNTQDYEVNRGITIDCGYVTVGQEIYVEIETDAAERTSLNIYVVGFNEEYFREGYKILTEDKFETTKFTDTKIEGNINVSEDSVLFTSIPYEKGWTVKIDGKKVEITPFEDALVTVPISAGAHKVEFSYFTYGLKDGIIISAVCISLMIFLYIINMKKRSNVTETLISDEPDVDVSIDQSEENESEENENV